MLIHAGSRRALDRPERRAEYFKAQAYLAATMATCSRRHVGVALVRDNRVICTGYNGSPPGEPHCEDVGCLMENGHCVRTNHAEANAIAFCAREGINTKGATAYVTCEPCRTCGSLLRTAGIAEVIWFEKYQISD